MKIILGSKNKSKKEAIEIALNTLNISDYEILSIDVPSHVSSKPLNGETLIGAHNRNREVMKYCLENNIEYDLLISIEGGYEQVEDYYFIVTYASIIDKEGYEFIGKSQGLQITKNMFEWVKNGQSLNKVIEELLDNKDNKKSNGISGYLTDGYYYRSIFDSTSIISAYEAMKNYRKSYEKLERKLLSNHEKTKKGNTNDNYK